MRIQTRRQQIQELQTENKRLAQIQELLVDNILAVQESDVTWTGNRYKTYAGAVEEVAKKYAGTADWGVLQVGNIVGLRAAYIIGQGLKVSKVEAEGEDAAPEYKFAQRFIEKNELDHELAQDLAREGEIEGKTLIKLFPMKVEDEDAIEGVDIAIRWVSWTTNKYTVKVSPSDYLQLESVTWTPPAGTAVSLKPEECVYKRFAGRLDVPNETMPRVAKCLTQIEDLDKSLRDWKRINELFASPVPDFECDTAEQAKKINEDIKNLNWKIGKAFAHTGRFNFKQPSPEGQKAIETLIITLMKVISGTTGIPINALGCPELTTKYGADSQGMLDLIAMSTSMEREVWRAAYQEMIEKAMLMWNRETGKTPLRPKMIKVEIPVITAEQWARLVDIWLPIRTSKEITSKTFLSQVPGLDVEAEAKALEEEDAAGLEKFTDNSDGMTPEEVAQAKADKAAADRQDNPGAFMKKGAR